MVIINCMAPKNVDILKGGREEGVLSPKMLFSLKKCKALFYEINTIIICD